MQQYVVVDTDVFSYIFNNNDITDFASKLKGSVPVLSFVSVGELFFGAKKHNWGHSRISRLEEQIRRYLIAPADEDLQCSGVISRHRPSARAIA
jgi:predicted nucleic acid-binding protein